MSNKEVAGAKITPERFVCILNIVFGMTSYGSGQHFSTKPSIY